MSAAPLWPSLVALCGGACVGAVARWQLARWLNHSDALLPWGTLAANAVGAYLIGLCVAAFEHLPHLDPIWRLACITGFLGALTTFSTFSYEVVALLQQGRPAWALALAGLHLLVSLGLTFLGLCSVQWWARG